MFRKTKHLVSNFLGFPVTLSMGLKSAARDSCLLLGKVYLQVGWDAYRKHYSEAKVLSRHGESKQIFEATGFDTKDVAFGEMTQQVLYAAEVYESTFLYAAEGVGRYFDFSRREWIEYPEVIYSCSNCGERLEFTGASAVFEDDKWFVCCDIVMQKKTKRSV